MWSSDLHLHEQILLLALHDDNGTLHPSMFGFALAGGLAAELLTRGALGVRQNGRDEVVFVAKPILLRDRLLDESLELVATSNRPMNLAGWIGQFAAIKRLKDRVAEGLCERGIVKRAENRVMWVFPRVVYPTADPAPERRLVQQIERTITADAEPDPRLATLIALAHVTGILRYVVSEHILQTRRSRVGELVLHDAAATAAKSTIASAGSIIDFAHQAVTSS